MTKIQIEQDARNIDRSWWYSTIRALVGVVHKDEYNFGNPIIWNKLKEIYEKQNR